MDARISKTGRSNDNIKGLSFQVSVFVANCVALSRDITRHGSNLYYKYLLHEEDVGSPDHTINVLPLKLLPSNNHLPSDNHLTKPPIQNDNPIIIFTKIPRA